MSVSAIGVTAFLKASSSFPVGFIIDNWADDTDPISFDTLTIGEAGMNVNRQLVAWKVPKAYMCTMSVVAFSQSDLNLTYLANATTTVNAFNIKEDSITLAVTYPSEGVIATYKNGVILETAGGTGFNNSGKLKTKAYKFAFQNEVLAPI